MTTLIVCPGCGRNEYHVTVANRFANITQTFYTTCNDCHKKESK